MQAQVIFICGDQSGVGKTSICLGLLDNALNRGYKPEELAYIKPCTQCEDVQLLWKWCEARGIHHEGIGPILFRAGYSQEVIDGKHGTAQERREKVYKAVADLANTPGRKLVVVDGVGYPGVGSCVGVSNGQVAEILCAPVLLVGRPGVGNAIDSTIMAIEYFKSYKTEVIGAVWNKIPRKVSYHTFDKCKEYVTKYFEQNPPTPNFSVYGHIPLLQTIDGEDEDLGGSCAISCALRKLTKKSLEMTEEDITNSTRIATLMNSYINFDKIFVDLNNYYTKKSPI